MPLFTSLDHVAQRLDTNAEQLRRQALQLAAASAAASWRSPAALVFRRRSETTCRQLRECATDVERTADELRRHAQHARAVAHLVTTAAHTAVHVGEDIAQHAVSAFTDLGI